MKQIFRGLGVVALAAGLLLAGGIPAQAAAGAQTAQAQSFIQTMGDQVIGYLKAANMDQNTKKTQLKSVLQSRFDVPTISRFTLGQYWKQLNTAQQAEYQTLFEDMVASLYAERFSTYSGQHFKVSKATAGDNGDVTVASSIIDPNGAKKDIAVNWRVRMKDGTPKIIDVTIEDVSMIITQRSEFASIIQRSGGNPAAVIDHLRQRVGKS